MEQALGNLISNACQAMPDGGQLTLTAQGTREQVALSIADTGSGIAPENMRQLFEPLFTTRARGIGLGLAVSRKLIEANGGKIEVQSQPGQGSTFTVFLPSCEARL
jgi:signal transduction histidine kinase